MLLENLRIEIYADGADEKGILELYRDPLIRGITTNPSLMRKAGVTDYEAFARRILETVVEKPISFEVLSDDFDDMRRQALKIAGWGSNVFVKIPVMNTRRETSLPLIRELSHDGVQVNITAVIVEQHIIPAIRALRPDVPGIVSIFAGRIADTIRKPGAIMIQAAATARRHSPRTKILWASVREPLNILKAERCDCHIVTVPHDILAKARAMADMDLMELSAKTVEMFARDAAAAGFTL